MAIRRFFEDYKKNENKEVQVDEIYGAEEALQAVKHAMEMYQDQYVPKRAR
jgi:inorganic pyrophosphatase